MLNDIKLEGTLHTFGDKCPGALPLQVLSVDNEIWAPPRHSHDFCEIVYIRGGSAMHVHGDNRYPIHAGDCCFMAPHDIEGFDNRDHLCLTNVMFYPRILDPVMPELSALPGFNRFFGIEPLFRDENRFTHKLHLSAAQQREMSFHLSRLENELKREESGFRVSATGMLYELIVFINRCFSRSIAKGPAAEEFAGKEQAVSAAIAFMERNFHKSINVTEIATVAQLSPARLSQKFREVTGASLIDYLTRFRIDAACALLLEDSLSVKEISYQVGFHDPAYFARAFAKVMSMSPSDFRKEKAVH